jgi:hypothetical protein
MLFPVALPLCFDGVVIVSFAHKLSWEAFSNQPGFSQNTDRWKLAVDGSMPA